MDPPVECSTWIEVAEEFMTRVKSNCSSCPDEGVKNCKEQQGTECVECEDLYELDQNTCTCIEGYVRKWENGSYICKEQVENCTEYKYGICTSCAEGFLLEKDDGVNNYVCKETDPFCLE